MRGLFSTVIKKFKFPSVVDSLSNVAVVKYETRTESEIANTSKTERCGFFAIKIPAKRNTEG